MVQLRSANLPIASTAEGDTAGRAAELPLTTSGAYDHVGQWDGPLDGISVKRATKARIQFTSPRNV